VRKVFREVYKLKNTREAAPEEVTDEKSEEKEPQKDESN
jgi:hypothetical protein